MSETPKLKRSLSGKVRTYVLYIRTYVHAYMWRMGPPAVVSCGGCICGGLMSVWSGPLSPTSHGEKLGLVGQTKVYVVCEERAYVCAWCNELNSK